MSLEALLQAHKAKWEGCQKCPLGATAFKHVIFDYELRGKDSIDVLLCGEAPGESEATLGIPFVGVSGRLLRDVLKEASDSRSYLITNVICCRPFWPDNKKNRMPDPAEIKACSDRLYEIIEICNPKVIVTLGRIAQWNLPMDRGHDLIMNTVHPSAICRDRGIKSKLYPGFVKTLKEAFSV